MKVIISSGKEPASECGWYFLADSAVSNTGKPFYLPENHGEVTVSLVPVVRISRLGKSIVPKFASRYYSECAPGVHFRLPQFEEELISKGLPGDAARNFDRSLFVGEFFPMEETVKIELKINGEKVSEIIFEGISHEIDEMLSKVSKMNTIKMGDYLVPEIRGSRILKEGDLIEVMRNGERAFHVKVK